jgi:RNA polymerase subunit RPABC4/transcription elongation factor Spt4
MAAEEVARTTEGGRTCVCPFCEGVVQMSAPWCEVCSVEIRICVTCEEPLPKDATLCPSCGEEYEE